MILLNGIKPVGDGIYFEGQVLSCWLPSCMQNHIPYNPRQLPVPIRRETNEDYYLRLAMRRVFALRYAVRYGRYGTEILSQHLPNPWG